MKTKTSTLPFIALAGLLTSGAAAAQAQPPAAERFATLTVAVGADPVGIEPALHFHAPGKLIMQHIGESLVAHRNDMSVAPMLAQRVESSPDGTRYTFTLRPEARFHNGQPVTAADVAWIWENYYLDPATGWDCRQFYDGSGTIQERTVGAHITAIKAVDERTLVFELAKPSNLFLTRLADVSCAPVIIHRDSWTADGSFDRPLGTGPYTFVEWRQGESVRLKRFEDYVPRSEPRDGYAGAKVAYAEEILVQVYADREAAFDALRSGTLDIVTDVQESERMWLEGTPGISIQTTSTINFWNLLIQTRDPLLSDPRMRRAIAHAINLDYLATVLTEGRQSANPSVISQNSEFHSAVHDRGHEFNLQTSRELLRAAGYAGQPVEIQTNRDGYPEMYRLAVLVRSMLQAAGINAVLNIMPWEEQLNTHYRSGSFQLQAFGQGGRNHAALVYGKFIGSKDELARFQWDDPAISALLNKAHEVTTPAEQQALFDELHLRMLEAVPTLALLNFEYHDAVRATLQGFHTTPFMRTTLWGVRRAPE